MDRLCAIIFTILVAMVTYNNKVQGKSKYSWMQYDHFDEIDEIYQSVDENNCRSKSRDQLVMRADVVSQLPVYNQLLSRIWYRNRTTLIHIHNMALNRAFFYSYVLQKMNTSETFMKQPNWMYFYFSATADVNANPDRLNGSAFYFDTDCHYPNWYATMPFNTTLPLFGPRAYRWDDYADQDNFLREPTRQVAQAVDFGSGHSMNYTNARFKMNPWYTNWLPDVIGDMDSVTKFSYYIGLKESNVTGQFITDEYVNYAFFGPNSPGAGDTDERKLPVQFTAPYFDCGGSNKWVVSAVSPVVDFMPRYSNYTHLRRARHVGVSVMDTDFLNIDYNACGVSPGNPGPSYLSGISRCRPKTGCKHKIGYGFKRGNYICHCKPGGTYPWWSEQPFQGDDVEVATEDEYLSGYFECTGVDYRLVLPVVDQLSGVTIEGGSLQTNSGGMPLDYVNSRKKRGTGNSTADYRTVETARADTGTQSANSTETSEKDNMFRDQPVVEETINGHTLKEIMELAEKLRQMRENNQQEKLLQFKDRTISLKFGEQTVDTTGHGYVDYEVERQYENDVRDHKKYKEWLKEDAKNKSTTVSIDAIKDDVTRLRDRHMDRFHTSRNTIPKRRRKRSLVYDHQAFDRMMRIIRKKASVTKSNCHTLPNHQLFLPGDVAYGVRTQFAPEGRTALRLTQFLSLYLQNVMPEENFGNLRGGGILHKDMLFGEVIANVMGNSKILSAGLFFDRYKFQEQNQDYREFFGPWAFKKGGSFYAMDRAGLSSYYVDEEWFRRAKERFSTNFNGLKMYKLRAYVRSDPNGTSSVRHEFFPVIYRAAPYEVGFWTRPHFRCDGNVDAWVVTYVTPFFGMDELRTKLEFRGVATVDVPLNLLEINQCPQAYSVANAFKNTARCHYFSTRCVPQAGFNFMRGSYRCLCKLGFEYWHQDGKFWIEGSLMELEWEKKQAGIFSRFDSLTCRVAGASGVQVTWLTTFLLVLISFFLKSQS